MPEKRATPLFFAVVMLLAVTGCSGLTSAGLPNSAHATSGAGNSSSSSSGTSSSTGTSSSSGSAGSGSSAGSSSNNSSGTVQASVSSTTVNFGNVTVGATITQQIQVTNTGTANVTVTENAATGAGFAASGIGSGLILKPAQSVTLTVSFKPAGTGQVTGAVTLVSDAWSTPATISLSGIGVEAAATAHTASLAWNASSSLAVGYNAYRSTQSGGPYTQLNSILLSGTSYADRTVAGGQAYFYVVTAVDALGTESNYSNEVSATIP